MTPGGPTEEIIYVFVGRFCQPILRPRAPGQSQKSDGRENGPNAASVGGSGTPGAAKRSLFLRVHVRFAVAPG